MARIKNPYALAAWLARKQMAQTQQQNVATYDQGGVPGQTRQNLTNDVAQQAAYQEAMAQQASAVGSPPQQPKNQSIFEGESIFKGNIFK